MSMSSMLFTPRPQFINLLWLILVLLLAAGESVVYRTCPYTLAHSPTSSAGSDKE